MIPDLPPPEFLEQSAILLPQDALHTPHFMERCYHWSMKAPLVYLFIPLFPSYSHMPLLPLPKNGKHSKCLMQILCLYVSLLNVYCCFVCIF